MKRLAVEATILDCQSFFLFRPLSPNTSGNKIFIDQSAMLFLNNRHQRAKARYIKMCKYFGRGFTIIELIIALIILGILSAIALTFLSISKTSHRPMQKMLGPKPMQTLAHNFYLPTRKTSSARKTDRAAQKRTKDALKTKNQRW